MAYVPPSDVPSAFLISTDAHAVLLDLLGTFVLLDGGAEKTLEKLSSRVDYEQNGDEIFAVDILTDVEGETITK
ncbi:hypothetical protein Aduo_004988 [Ancylostoma duodenale]